MKRLLYIILAAVIAVTAITAQSPEGAGLPPGITDADTATTADTLMPDTAVVPDSLLSATTLTDSVIATRHPNRKRYVSAVDNAATRTQHHNDAQGDSARILEQRRLRSIHYHDENGNMIMVDTITGQEWVDSTLLPPPPKMKQPLMYALEAGVNIWDPVMRIFGQKYGGLDFSLALNLHNRYIPTFEAGFGMADKTPAGMNFTYRSPLAPYFKIGADYNFIYNSDPDYRFVVGARYGFSAFRYSVENVHFDNNYWGEAGTINFPTQNVNAGWFELVLGLRVKIVGPISAGWMFRYHSMLHHTTPATGDAWYIPGFGTANSSITGSFSIVYNFHFKHKEPVAVDEE